MSGRSQNPTNPTRSRARKPGPMTPEQRKRRQEVFLATYSDVGIIKHACRVAGIDRSTYYEWKNNDSEFAAKLPEADEEANDTLEYAAYEQSVLGTEEPVVSAGKAIHDDDGAILTVRRYSPQLLITLLKARMPHKYKDQSRVEHSGPGGGPLQHAIEIYKVRIPDNGRDTPEPSGGNT